MHFESWSAFWDMGGYALYVWLAFGVSFLALLLILIDSLIAKRYLFVVIHNEALRKQRILDAKKSQGSDAKTRISATNLTSGENQ